MSLANLIRKRSPGGFATAIPAIPATHGREKAGTVARIATIAVATTPGERPEALNCSKNSNNSSSNPPPARHWLLHFPDREPVEIFRSPPATLEEVLADNTGAIAAEPVHDQVQINVEGGGA